MKKKLYIVGAGSVGGHIALNLQEYTEQYELGGFFDDDPEKVNTKQFGSEVIGPVSEVLKLKDVSIVIGIAFPKVKRKIVDYLSENRLLKFPTLVHRKAWISNDVMVGRGSVIYPGVSINYGSVIGDFVVMNMNCAVGHHSIVESYSSLAPGVNLGGHSVLKKGVDMGIGSVTIQSVTVGEGSIIGGQAIVVHNIPPYSTAIGVPAKIK